MKAAIIVESFAYGTAKSVKQLASLLKRDNEVTVFYGHRDGTDLELQDLDPHITWWQLPGSGPTKHFYNLWFLARTISHDTRVIHGHSTFAGAYARLLALLKRRSAVLYSPRGYAFLREDYSNVVRKLFWLFEKGLARVGTTVACGPAESRIAQQLSPNVTTINNGFEVPESVNFDFIGDEIVCVGRVSIQKGYDIFKEIAQRLPDKRFVWIGSAGDGCERLLENTPSNVHLVPYLPHDELIDRIKNARFILLPSRWEGLSRVLIESICHGKAIVTSTCPANVDCLCGDGGDGSQYTNGFACSDVLDYLDAIEALDSNTILLRSMQKASYEFARDAYSMSTIAEKWRRLYFSAGHAALPKHRKKLRSILRMQQQKELQE